MRHSSSCFALSGVLLATFTGVVRAQYTEHQWVGGTGGQSWHVGSNWDLGNVPNDTTPGDTDLPTANLSVGLAGDLNVSLGTTSATLAGLTLGGTSGAVTTEISSGGPAGRLIFRNDFDDQFSNTNDADFDNDGLVAGSDFLIWQRNNGFVNTGPDNINDTGDANDDDVVDATDLGIWQSQFGFGASLFDEEAAFLTSRGVAGSVNRISAPTHLEDDDLQIDAMIPLVFDPTATITNEAADMASNASLSVVRGTVTVDSQVVVTNVDTTPLSGGIDVSLNSFGANGTLILNGVVRDANPAEPGNVRFGGGNGRTEIYGDNELTGTVRTGGDVILGHDHALGVNPSDPMDVSTVIPGGTHYSDDDARNLPNRFVLSGFFNVAGDKTLTLSGEVTQTNNRGFNNNIEGPGMLILDGLLNIWEDDEALRREFDFTGSGTTKITGVIRDDPELSGLDRGFNHIGPGVLIIDVELGDNNHGGETRVARGNVHYADNDSLNQGLGMIRAVGGAVGVDTGVANNATFMAKIDPDSTGGLMLAASDAAAALDFTSTLANAAGMTVAAPETDLTYTGAITPANATYGLGGGSGKLTLPNAQLSGTNAVVIRNGGSVELLGDNTYTGPTTVMGRPEDVTLIVDDLADGGAASSIGAASSDAENLYIQGSTFRYEGSGDSTDRLFTIGTLGATIESSGTGPLVFSNPGLLGRDDAEPRSGTLDDFTGNPDVITEIADTSDIVAGMAVSDPDSGGTFTQPPCEPGGANCIPAGTVVTGVSSNSVGLSNSFPFILKENTTIVFGTVERTLTLSGDNAGDNVLASIISDSPLGGVVAVEKTGTGRWILSGSNAYTGDTTVEDGVLSITSAFLDADADVHVNGAGVLELDFAGENAIAGLFFDGVEQASGTWGAPGNGLADFTSSFLSGAGLLNVAAAAVGATVAVPEPSTWMLAALASLTLFRSRRTMRPAKAGRGS